MLAVELLERVVGQHGGARLLCDAEQKGVAPADGAGRRRDDLAVGLRLVECLALRLVDPVPERGVDHHGDLGVRELALEFPDRLVKLGQGRHGATLGGDVGPVHDDAPICHLQ